MYGYIKALPADWCGKAYMYLCTCTLFSTYMYICIILHVYKYMLEVAKQQVCVCVSCMLHTILKYRDNEKHPEPSADARRCIMRVYTREIRMEKWPTVRLAVQRRECWISATERFQRKPQIFDLRCPLST